MPQILIQTRLAIEAGASNGKHGTLAQFLPYEALARVPLGRQV